MTEELALSDYERGFLMGFFEFEAKQKMREEGFDDPNIDSSETFWIGVQCGTRMFDFAVYYIDKNLNAIVYECSPSDDGTNWVTNMSLGSERLI